MNGWPQMVVGPAAQVYMQRLYSLGSSVLFYLQLFHFAGNAAIIQSQEAVIQQVLW